MPESAFGLGRQPFIETSYDRPGKPKLLNRTQIQSPVVALDPNLVLKRFHWLVGVDTNEGPANSGGVQYCGMVVARLRGEHTGGLSLHEASAWVFELHDVEGKTERVGWWAALRSIQLEPSTSVGVIVDSDQQHIEAINSRKEAVVGDWLLPGGFELLYATSDSGSEYMANALIRRADHIARDAARKLRSELCSEALRESNSTHHGDWRIWKYLESTP